MLVCFGSSIRVTSLTIVPCMNTVYGPTWTGTYKGDHIQEHEKKIEFIAAFRNIRITTSGLLQQRRKWNSDPLIPPAPAALLLLLLLLLLLQPPPPPLSSTVAARTISTTCS